MEDLTAMLEGVELSGAESEFDRRCDASAAIRRLMRELGIDEAGLDALMGWESGRASQLIRVC